MILHENKCIFIHQRKVAGLAIMAAFGIARTNPDKNIFNDGFLSPRQSKLWHEKARDFPDYFVFTAVRNPWDRFISAWKYCLTTRERSLNDVLQNPPELGKNKQEDHDYRHLIRPQVDSIRETSGNFITDYIIRFEALQEGFDEVCDLIGRPRARLLILNATNHRPYASYYDAETRGIVAEMFKDDIESFGYTFENTVSPVS